MSSRLREVVSSLTAVLLLAAAAVLACTRLTAPNLRHFLPAVFVVIVVAVALRYGALAGVVGSLVCAAVFARWLYPPLGSLRVQDSVARDHIGWMLLAGISLSYLLAAPHGTHKHHH